MELLRTFQLLAFVMLFFVCQIKAADLTKAVDFTEFVTVDVAPIWLHKGKAEDLYDEMKNLHDKFSKNYGKTITLEILDNTSLIGIPIPPNSKKLMDVYRAFVVGEILSFEGNIASLRLTFSSTIDDKFVRLVTSEHALQEVFLKRLAYVTTQGILDALQRKNLRYLNISQCPNLDREKLRPISKAYLFNE